MIDILRDYGLILLIGQYPQGPLGGLAMTLVLAALALVIAFPLSILVGLARVSAWKPLARAAAFYVHTVRGLPLLLVVFWAYFLVPMIGGKGIDATVMMLFALVVYESAYMGEIVRAGIDALPRGQMEAARALGMRTPQIYTAVILPQALFNMIPSLLSQFVVLVKNTSLAYVIGVDELTNAAYQVNGQLLTKPFEIYGLLAISYFGMCYALGRGVSWIERRIVKRRTGAAPVTVATNQPA
jgi:polar amino acid transport system permease protein